jgi:hypothetical protein
MSTSTPPSTGPSEIHTAGGAAVSGNVHAGRDFIGRDQINITIQMPNAQAPTSVRSSINLHLINFARPLTERQRDQIEQMVGYRISRTIDVPTHFNNEQSYAEQAIKSVDQVGLSMHDWQTLPILVNPSGYTPGALCLITELHGRMGYFPTIIGLRPTHEGMDAFEVAEIIHLRALRLAASHRG